MRTQKVVLNSIFNISSQLVQLILSFIIRNLFIRYIGIEYLGLNGLFSNILSALNLADLGVGAAITYHLYGPLATKNIQQINSLMKFYKKTYYAIGFTVLVIGTISMFFIQYLIKGQRIDLSFLRVVFFIQLLGTTSTYFLAYKRTLLFADQKGYISALVDSITQITMMLVRVLTLVIFKNYIIYLVIILMQNVLANVIISKVCCKVYPFLAQKTGVIPIDKKDIINSLKNISIEKIVSYIYYSTDNIIISKFLGISIVGLLSNYTLIVVSIKYLFSQITSSIQASLGNLVHSEENIEKTYDVFNKFTFLCFICISFSTVSLLVLTPSFISLWLGSKYVMSYWVIVLLSISFYSSTMRIPLDQLSSVYGMFRQMKYISVIGAILNLAISLTLINYIGLAGTLLGTLICDFIYWAGQIYWVLNKKLNISTQRYCLKLFQYSLLTIAECVITVEGSKILFNSENIYSLLGRLLLCVIIPSTINLVIYKRTTEFYFFKDLIKTVYKKSFKEIKIFLQK